MPGGAGPKMDAVVEVIPEPAALDPVVPADPVDEVVELPAHALQLRQGHFDELPLDLPLEGLHSPPVLLARTVERSARVGRAARAVLGDEAHDPRLPIRVLLEHAGRVSGHLERPGMRPVEADHLPRELACRDHRRRCTVASTLLKAQVHEPEQNRVLVGGDEASLVEQSDQLLGEADEVARLRALSHDSRAASGSRRARPRAGWQRRPPSAGSRGRGGGTPTGRRPHRRSRRR